MTTTNTNSHIAFIGIGLMGSRMAARLLQAGYQVTVHNRTPEKSMSLVKLGAKVADSVADAVSRADIVLTCLAGADAIEAVYFGEHGIVPAAPKSCLVIDLSSVAPDIARTNHRRLREAGYAHLDCPVTGGVSGAQEGSLSILVGGSEHNLQRARAVLETMGNPFHLGEEGAGQVCKLVNQTIVHIFIGGVAEGMMLAAAAGVDATKVREALMGGYCESKILNIHGAKMASRNFVAGGPLEFSVKDLEESLKMASANALDLPLVVSVLQNYLGMVNKGQGRLDHSALLLAYESANKPIRVSPDIEDKFPER
ncbi:MAG: NAD(P)-dependent oxidoreductase [Gammaproteobacteria bacterium]|nr:NAD(P)-dependent oxidoreductase [Gammaproteobacteria bacterium]MCP4880815.1 NAD(P)-dependent oxidoreductase [Gammaproteobacteria bacterium]